MKKESKTAKGILTLTSDDIDEVMIEDFKKAFRASVESLAMKPSEIKPSRAGEPQYQQLMEKISAMQEQRPAKSEGYMALRYHHIKVCDAVRKYLIEAGDVGPWTHTEGDVVLVPSPPNPTSAPSGELLDDREPWTGIIIRSPHTFGLCGYIGLPPGHKYWGLSYNDIDDISVHGGLTYSDKDQGLVSDNFSGERWWLGFDCGHYDDYSPMLPVTGKPEQYKTEIFVRNEIISLGKQLFQGDWKKSTFTDLLKGL